MKSFFSFFFALVACAFLAAVPTMGQAVSGVLSIPEASILDTVNEGIIAGNEDRAVYNVVDYGITGNGADCRDEIKALYDIAYFTGGEIFFNADSVNFYVCNATATDVSTYDDGLIFPGDGVVTRGVSRGVTTLSSGGAHVTKSFFSCRLWVDSLNETVGEPQIREEDWGGNQQRFENIALTAAGRDVVRCGESYNPSLGQLGGWVATLVRFTSCTFATVNDPGDYSHWCVHSAISNFGSTTSMFNYDCIVTNCNFGGGSQNNGILLATHMLVDNCDFKDMNVGILCPPAMYLNEIRGGRFEGGRFQLAFGYYEDDINAGPQAIFEQTDLGTLNGAVLTGGIYFESNTCSIIGAGIVSGTLSMQAFEGAARQLLTSVYDGSPIYGVFWKGGIFSISGSISGNFTGSVVRSLSGANVQFSGENYNNITFNRGYAAHYDGEDPTARSIFQTVNTAGFATGVVPTSPQQLGALGAFRAFSARNSVYPQVKPKNFMMRERTWPANANHHFYRFPRWRPEWIAPTWGDPVNHANGNLPDGNYRYQVSVITPWCEYSNGIPTDEVVAGAEDAVDVHAGTLPAPGEDYWGNVEGYEADFKVRVYRYSDGMGMNDGIEDEAWAYFDLPLNQHIENANSSVSAGVHFYDLGLVPDGYGFPPGTTMGPELSRHEVDDRYTIVPVVGRMATLPVIAQTDKSARSFTARIGPSAGTVATFTTAGSQCVCQLVIDGDTLTVTSEAGGKFSGGFCNVGYIGDTPIQRGVRIHYDQQTPQVSWSHPANNYDYFICMLSQAHGVATTADLATMINNTLDFTCTGGDSTLLTTAFYGFTDPTVSTVVTPGQDAGTAKLYINAKSHLTSMNGKTVTIVEGSTFTGTFADASEDGSKNITVTLPTGVTSDLYYAAEAINSSCPSWEAHLVVESGDGRYNATTQAPPTVANTSGAVAPHQQTLTTTGSPTGGTTKLTVNGQETGTLNHNATAEDVDAALESLANIAADELVCTGGPWPAGIVVEFQGPTAADITSTSYAITGGSIQQIYTTGVPDGGTTKLTANAQETGTLNHNATAADVDTALEALATIPDGSLTCTGGPWPAAITVTYNSGTPYTITVTNEVFTGGTSPTAVATSAPLSISSVPDGAPTVDTPITYFLWRE